MLLKRNRLATIESSNRGKKTVRRLLLGAVVIAVVIAGAVATAAPATAAGVSPAQLSAAGWNCFVRPIGEGIVCANPGLGRPPLPPVADGRPSYMFLLFDGQGNFTATELLIRADLYRGQLCGDSGEPYVFRDRIGYYECVHP